MLEKRSKEHGERIVSIFFDAAKDVCHERMVNSRNEEAANDRTKKYESFLSGKDNADYVIDASRPLEEVTMALYEILQSEMMTHSYPY